MFCGRALCPACVASPSASRLVCSSECRTALESNEGVIQLLLDKSMQSALASAHYYYLCGGLSAGAAVAAWFMLPSPFLIYFTAACALVCFTAGFWHGHGGKSAVGSNRPKSVKFKIQ
jgi:hypothetical protein